MNKIIAIALSIIMLFLLCACSGQKAEKYCSSCGKGISKDVAFCEHCGAANNLKTEDEDILSSNSSSIEYNTEETSTPTSTTQNTSKPTETNKPSISTTTHTHSYSKKVTAATCTEKGYTTYTCLCGVSYADDYVNPSHTYLEYICSSCNAIDKTHTFEYLVNWLIKYGQPNGQISQIEYVDASQNTYIISYEKKNNAVVFHMSYVDSNYYRSTYLTINKISNTYDYSHTCYNLDYDLSALIINGQVESNNFTRTSPISYSNYSSDIYGSNIDLSIINNELDVARMDLVLLLLSTEGILQGQFNSPNNSGLFLSDLGFNSFMASFS